MYKLVGGLLLAASVASADEWDNEWEDVTLLPDNGDSVPQEDYLYEEQISAEGREVLVVTPEGLESPTPELLEPTNDYLD